MEREPGLQRVGAGTPVAERVNRVHWFAGRLHEVVDDIGRGRPGGWHGGGLATAAPQRVCQGRNVDDWRNDRIGSALRGENPTVLRKLPGGFAVIGDVQWLPGYCVLLTDDPRVERMSDLTPIQRRRFLDSMADLAEAVERACAVIDPRFRRVNVEVLGNTDPYLHAHVWPRYDWEPPELVGKPVWLYPASHWSDPRTALGPEHDALRASIASHLQGLSRVSP